MNDKYYTPGIEEFYVGFEYEFQTVNKKWVKDSVEGLMDEYYRGCTFRVKYLDQEDIESLGFKYVDSEPIPLYRKEVDKNHSWILTTQDYEGGCELRVWITSKGFEQKPGYFEGTIKNKSELKRILKQIGYE